MVTPVHRFQSIESVANNGLRHGGRWSTAGYPSRSSFHNHSSSHYHGQQTRSTHQPPPRPLEAVTHDHHQVVTAMSTARRNSVPTAKLKCGVWFFFAVVTFFLAGAKYYFHGVNVGIEAFAFCSLLVIILIIGGLVSLYEAITATVSVPQREEGVPVASVVGGEVRDETRHDSNQVPTSPPPLPPHSPPTSQNPAELPPPPYHIAIMLPLQNNDSDGGGGGGGGVGMARDSPPPSYEKVMVT